MFLKYNVISIIIISFVNEIYLTLSQQPQPPNIVFFMADDFPFVWDEKADSLSATKLPNQLLFPNLNRIRTNGAVFLNAHVAGPVRRYT